MMQDLVGIVRTENEMQKALVELRIRYGRGPKKCACSGNREYNPGWHTALDLNPLLTVSEAITRSAIERKESRGGHFREDFPDKDPAYATFNVVSHRDPAGEMQIRREPVKPMPEELKEIIEEMK